MPLTPNQLETFIAKCLPARLPFMVTGAPGIGKSDIIESACKVAGFDLLMSHPAVSDPTDYKGLPWMQAGDTCANFVPFGDFHLALTATRPTLWFFDDYGQSNPSVQSATMQLFRARRVNSHVLPDCITFGIATNRRIDRAGVSGILEPVKSRVVSIVELEANINDWCNWAFDNGIPPILIAFLRYRSELLSAFTPSADLTNSPSPRTWSHLAKLEALSLPLEIEGQAMAGAVGEGAATEYLAFRQMANSLVNLDGILLDPSNARIPVKPDQLYATCIGLAGRANVNNFSAIATYASRLATEQVGTPARTHGEHAVLLVRDAQRKDPKVMYTDAFVRLSSGPIGKLFSGQ